MSVEENVTNPTWRQILATDPRNDVTDKTFGAIAEHTDAPASIKTLVQLEPSLLHQQQPDDTSNNNNNLMMMVMPAKNDGMNDDTNNTTKPRLMFLHHLSKLQISTGGDEEADGTTTATTTTTTTSVYVALEGLEEQATPVEIALPEAFEDKVKVSAPAWEILKTLDSVPKVTKSLEETQQRSDYYLRPVQFLPPCLYKAMVLNSTAEGSPAILLVEALQAVQEHIKTHPVSQGYDDATVFARPLVAYLWNAALDSKSNAVSLPVKITMTVTLPEVQDWSQQLHESMTKKPSVNNVKIEEMPALGMATTVDSKSSLASNLPVITADTAGGVNGKVKPPKKTRTWQENFARLVAYKEGHGDCNVPREYSKDKALGEWVKNQRSVSKTLPAERRAQLEEIGFTFSSTQVDRSRKIWEGNYQKLVAATERNGGNFNVTLKEDRSLQHWVTIQRQAHRRGNMDEERKKKLDDIGFVWKIKNDYTPRKKNDLQWQKGFAKLQEFHEEHGHCNVPKRGTDSRPLWEWLYSQRKAYNENRLPADRVHLMEGLGMKWEVDNGQVIRDQQWDSKFEEAKAFFDKHHHLEVPRSGKFGNTNLLKWLLRQREQFKNDKLSDVRKKKLEALNFDFVGESERRDKLLEELNWKDRFHELEQFEKETGIIPDGGSTAKEKSLSKWVAKQQVAYQFHDLVSARKEMLDKLGVVFPAQMPEPPMKKRQAPPSPRGATTTKTELTVGDNEMDGARTDDLGKRKAVDEASLDNVKKAKVETNAEGGTDRATVI